MHRIGPRAARASGFSLLEIILVIAIIALASVLAAAAMGGGFKGMQLKASAKQIASNLRYTRDRQAAELHDRSAPARVARTQGAPR